MASRGQLRAADVVRHTTDGRAFAAREIPWVFSHKSWLVDLILIALRLVHDSDERPLR